MAEFEDSLNALLSNEALMGQIMSLAKNFGEGSGESTTPSDTAPESNSERAQASPFGDLLSGFSSFDPAMIGMIGTLVQEYQHGGKETTKNLALIEALRPFLKEKRQAQIDRAVKLAGFARLARVAFRTMKGGEGAV